MNLYCLKTSRSSTKPQSANQLKFYKDKGSFRNMRQNEPIIEKFALNSGNSCGGFFSLHKQLPRTDLTGNISRKKNLMIREEFFGLLIYDKDSKEAYWTNDSASKIIGLLEDKTAKEISKGAGLNLGITNSFLKKLNNLGLLGKNPAPVLKLNPEIEAKNFLRTPAKAYWIINKKCNLKCKHCFTDAGVSDKNELKFNEMKSILRQLKEMGVFQVSLSGGEPFLCKDIFKLGEYANRLGLDVYTPSNGTLINKETIKKIKKAGFIYIEISLDFIKPEKHDKNRGLVGTFNKALNAIKLLKENKVPVMLIAIAFKENYNEIAQVIRLAEKIGIDGVRLLRFRTSGRANLYKKQLEIPYDKYKRLFGLKPKIPLVKDTFFNFNSKSKLNYDFFGCPAGRQIISIHYDGTVQPCGFFPKEKFNGGNIRTNSLIDIWNDSKVFKVFRNLNPEFCKNCKNFKKCHGGCRVEAYSKFKSLSAPDPLCPKLNRR